MQRYVIALKKYWAWWLLPFVLTTAVLLALLFNRPQRDTVRMMYDLTQRP